MPLKDTILQEIEQIPDALLDDVLSFVRSLKVQHLGIDLETCLLSETVLAKDWLRAEEEEAWQDL